MNSVPFAQGEALDADLAHINNMERGGRPDKSRPIPHQSHPHSNSGKRQASPIRRSGQRRPAGPGLGGELWGVRGRIGEGQRLWVGR
jgi:hypothetical protein